MKLRNSKERYGFVHQLLHAGMAGLIFYALYLGLTEQQIPLHKMLGVTVLALVILRLIWRWADGVPAPVATARKSQQRLADFAHWMLYVLMVLMPFCGWVMSNAAGYPVSFWGLYELPTLVEKNKEIRHLAGEVHFWGGWAFIILISLHFLAALQHQFILRDGLLWRMFPCGRKKAAMLALSEEDKRIIEKAPWA